MTRDLCFRPATEKNLLQRYVEYDPMCICVQSQPIAVTKTPPLDQMRLQ